MTEIPAAHRSHRRVTWSIVAVLIVVVPTLSARWGLHLYRCHVVDRQARKGGRELYVQPIGPEWIHRLLGSSPHFIKLVTGRPMDVELEFASSWNSRAEIKSVVGCLSGLESIEHLGLEGDGVTDVEVLRLQDISRLSRLDLRGTRATARGLIFLGDHPNLKSLGIRNATSIDDAAIAQVARASQLEFLNLDGTMVTDAGLAHLKSLTNLQSLSLNNTAISNAGLLHLRDLTNLTFLSVSNTSVTDAGVDALREALHDLEVTDD